jgi:pimeloyl-ACP methyl ester carboxylesterase
MENHFLYDAKPIYYQSRGKGNTIVLLHGFTESRKIWKDFTKRLSKDFRVVTVDLPGHRKTPVFGQAHTMEFMADVVKALLAHLKIHSCIVIGHSMGGYVTLAFANKYPELVEAFGLFHSHAAVDTEEARENRQRTIYIVEQNRTGFIQQFIPGLFAPENVETYKEEIESLKKQALIPPADGISAALRGMMEREDHTGLLRSTEKPVLFIIGKKDSKIPVETVLEQAALPHHTEVLILGDAGHMGFIEARKQTLEFIQDFCKRVFDRSKPNL